MVFAAAVSLTWDFQRVSFAIEDVALHLREEEPFVCHPRGPTDRGTTGGPKDRVWERCREFQETSDGTTRGPWRGRLHHMLHMQCEVVDWDAGGVSVHHGIADLREDPDPTVGGEARQATNVQECLGLSSQATLVSPLGPWKTRKV
ncbi:uncharacterized protein MYCGRDRAFT_93701 [Zymoseptoria tritici IPO323]|uniref:Uncharacterized protein n=1 Tax=Zymoseptoria tritici (strain CBS 115943 / IPO323) TaxID=336722 RepID=F9XCQ6_ZYMTI|nr:uncharacterized protein MYCGRDRAFT_93701 [Zymoseptoria tritici IPO323]EGP86347.1 hypothetical protein MYCGRDRAFT_93701 [Zymoseptoria tritici IPO323]